jgi:hypothetical protein
VAGEPRPESSEKRAIGRCGEEPSMHSGGDEGQVAGLGKARQSSLVVRQGGSELVLQSGTSSWIPPVWMDFVGGCSWLNHVL